jgi:hypothetical protein
MIVKHFSVVYNTISLLFTQVGWIFSKGVSTYSQRPSMDVD